MRAPLRPSPPPHPAAAFATVLLAAIAVPGQAPPDAAARQRARAAADLRTVSLVLPATPHAYDGVCTSELQGEQRSEPIAIPWRGAWADPLDFWSCQDFQVVAHGDQRIVRRGDGDWTGPQGVEPDCPLAPGRLAPHLPTATVVAVAAGAFADRPAMQAVVAWTGDDAARLAEVVNFPWAQRQTLLEQVARICRQQAERAVVDAVVTWDPASKELLAATVRLAVLRPVEPDADPEPVPGPTGMPTLPRPAIATFVFELRRVPPATVPLPELGPRERDRLGLPGAARSR